jgi:DNA/RNA-binding domain of Phe-tRNA-synthetase-like protein
MDVFQYHPDILTRFPNTIGGIIRACGIRGGPSSESLLALYLAEQQAVLKRIGANSLSQIESLSAWRSVFRGFGVEPTQFRSAAEALLRRLTKQGDIPTINCLVDIGNLVSIRYALPVAVFDTRAAQGPITVRFSDGSERFTPLGAPQPEHPEPGEVIFSDAAMLVFARRWCWRQSDQSAARDDTTDAVITVEAHHAKGRADVESALADLTKLLAEHAGGQFVSAILDAHTPTLAV